MGFVDLSIMTYCSGYSYNIFNRFVGSLRDTGSTTPVYFFSEERDKPILKRIQKEWDNIYYFISDPTVETLSFRYFAFFQEIDQIQTSHILLCDARDVLFQKNPEAELGFMKGFVPEKVLLFFAEDKRIGECWLNYKWIEDLAVTLQDYRIAGLADCIDIICAGTTFGTKGAIKNYLSTMCNYYKKVYKTLPVKKYENGRDQGLHNYLIYSGIFSDFLVLTNDTPFINTIGYSKVILNAENQIMLSRTGKVPTIVHQYDRIAKNIKKMISPKYDFTE